MNEDVIGRNGSAMLTCPSMHMHGWVHFEVAYSRDEPLTIAVEITDTTGAEYAWLVDRRLAEEACVDGDRNGCAVVGVGDVTLKVRRSDRRTITLRLPAVRSSGERGFVYLIVSRDQLRKFIGETYELVPAHREVDYLNLDDIDKLVEEWK